MVVAAPRLARRRPPELCGPGGRRAPLGGRLSWRREMARGRARKELVRADQVAAVVPSDPRRHLPGRAAVADLRRPGLLSPAAGALKAALAAEAHAQGFDRIGVVSPDAIPASRSGFSPSWPRARRATWI